MMTAPTSEVAEALPEHGASAPAPDSQTPPAEAAAAGKGAAEKAPTDGEQPPAGQEETRTLEWVLEHGTQAQLMALMSDPEAMAKLGTAPAGKEEKTESGASGKETPDGVKPPVKTAEELEEERTPERIRIRSYDEQDQRLILAAQNLAKAEKIPFREAFNRLNKPADKPPAAATPEGGKKPDAVPTAFETVMAKITQLKTDIKSATASFDHDKSVDLIEQLGDAKAELRELERAGKAQEQTAEQQWKTAEETAFKVVEARFPDVQKAGSPLNTAVQARIAELEASNPEFFHNEKWFSLVTSEQAVELDIAPVAAAAPAKAQAAQAAKPTAVQPKATPPRQQGHPAAIAPAPGSAGSGQNQPGAPDVEKLVQSNSARELFGALGKMGRRETA